MNEQLKSAIQDRDVLERESAINVFEKAYGWAKLAGGIVAGVVTIVVVALGVFGVSKTADLFSAIDKANAGIAQKSSEAQKNLTEKATTAQKQVEATAGTAIQSVTDASGNAIKEAKAVETSATKAKNNLVEQNRAVQNDVAKLQTQVQSAGKLEADMRDMRLQLTKATGEIAAQQKLLENQELFVKNIFTSHRTEYFSLVAERSNNYVVVPRQPKGALVYMLLRHAPIRETVQLQFHVFSQQADTYWVFDNDIVVFHWGDPVESLRSKQVSVSYFPDKSIKLRHQKLVEQNGSIKGEGSVPTGP